jgi:hypothetical protein
MPTPRWLTSRTPRETSVPQGWPLGGEGLGFDFMRKPGGDFTFWPGGGQVNAANTAGTIVVDLADLAEPCQGEIQFLVSVTQWVEWIDLGGDGGSCPPGQGFHQPLAATFRLPVTEGLECHRPPQSTDQKAFES